VSRGHRLQDILRGYTMDQLQAFSVAAGTNRRREILETASAARMAAHAPRGPWKEFMNGLMAPAAPTGEQAPMSKAQVRSLQSLLSGGKTPPPPTKGKG